MKSIGYLLIAFAFLAGSLIAVQTESNQIDWKWFLPSLALGAAGVVLARMRAQLRSRHEGALNVNIDTLQTSIDRIVENIRQLNQEKGQLHPYQVHERIDELFPNDLNVFVEARKSIGHVYGLRAYADVMNDFAAGERYLNRVWSASVDCYVDDVRDYLDRAQHQFEDARRKLQALREQTT